MTISSPTMTAPMTHPTADTIPDKLPVRRLEISVRPLSPDSSYSYPGGLDKRFDMYPWGTQGFPNIGAAAVVIRKTAAFG